MSDVVRCWDWVLNGSLGWEVRDLHYLLLLRNIMSKDVEAGGEYFQDKGSSTHQRSSLDTISPSASFVDLSAAIALCCGAINVKESNDSYNQRSELAAAIGGCPTDSDEHAFDGNKEASFLIENNQRTRLRAVFPSTTPAALTSLATASWPGRHGMPGWNLRDKSGCDFPSVSAGPVVQILVLSDHIRDAKSGKLANEVGFDNWDKVFVEKPWSRSLQQSNAPRKMIYINAYNGDDYQNWSQGGASEGTDFSSWQMGSNSTNIKDDSPFDTAKIEETSFDTLGQPKGSTDAINFFRDGINAALAKISQAERRGETTFTYIYTAHPDKHMHSLGVEHEEVKKVIKGIDSEIKRFWKILADRDALIARDSFDEFDTKQEHDLADHSCRIAVDATVVVTADHGHVTVEPEQMICLPKNIVECLEYANIGVHGKGRHGYLHCRPGLHTLLLERWQCHDQLTEHFLILTVEEAIQNYLFGPQSMRQEVRPRLGDFVVISRGRHTLVTPNEAERYQGSCKCQGAHGSLLPEEMEIPFILLSRK
eukprot:scaffold60934_cov76-Cyclotella_meneghiniana.AAC.10